MADDDIIKALSKGLGLVDLSDLSVAPGALSRAKSYVISRWPVWLGVWAGGPTNLGPNTTFSLEFSPLFLIFFKITS